jgi:protein-export membrane protein SecD
MTKTIRSRLIIIGLLTLASIAALIPRNAKVRVMDQATGRMKDSTERKVPINLGLDLCGGIHLALEIDESKGRVPDCNDAIRRAERVVRTRVDEFGTTEPVVQVVGECRLIVELPGEKDPERAKRVVQRTAFLEFRITDMRNAFRDAISSIDKALLDAGVRATTASGPSAVSQLFGGDTTKRQAKDTATTDNQSGPLASLLFQGQQPGEFLVPDEQVARAESLLARPEVKRTLPRGFELMWSAQVESQGARLYRGLYAVDSRPLITGECLTKATAGRDQLTNQSEVRFTLSRRCGRKFGEETARHVNDYMAIILDGRVQGKPPIIKSQITTDGRIELGGKTLDEANDLALVLRAGALPAPLTIVEERTIGPTLGEDAIRDGIKAGVFGVLLVVTIMISYYRVAGALAVSALVLYALYTLAGLSGFGFTLTLPGLAGFVLSVGIAVDANVLIFERIREELSAGKSIRLAVDQGFARAMNAIVDSNVCAVITALFLYRFGTQAVKGFAITLVLGVLASMITAIFVTRTFFMIWLQRRPNMQTMSI